MSTSQSCRQSFKVHDSAPAVIDQVSSRLHCGDLRSSNHAVSGGRLRDMQADHIAVSQQGVEAIGWLRVTMSELVSLIIEDHSHTHGLSQVGQLRADVAIADNAQDLATNLMAADGRLVPLARVSGVGL